MSFFEGLGKDKFAIFTLPPAMREWPNGTLGTVPLGPPPTMKECPNGALNSTWDQCHFFDAGRLHSLFMELLSRNSCIPVILKVSV